MDSIPYLGYKGRRGCASFKLCRGWHVFLQVASCLLNFSMPCGAVWCWLPWSCAALCIMRMRVHLTTVLLAPMVLCRIVRNANACALDTVLLAPMVLCHIVRNANARALDDCSVGSHRPVLHWVSRVWYGWLFYLIGYHPSEWQTLLCTFTDTISRFSSVYPLLNLSNLGEPQLNIGSPIEPCYRFPHVMFQALWNSWRTRLVAVSAFIHTPWIQF